MKISLDHAAIELLKGHISLQEADAIVKAANRLAAGGGAGDAIHDAGEEPDRASRSLQRLAG